MKFASGDHVEEIHTLTNKQLTLLTNPNLILVSKKQK